MNCSSCGKPLNIHDTVFLCRLDENDYLVFCMTCEGNLPGPDEIHRLANKELYYGEK